MKPEESFEKLEVFRKVDDKLHVFGSSKVAGSKDRRLCQIVHDASTGKILKEDSFVEYDGFLKYFSPSLRERARKTEDYWYEFGELRHENQYDIDERNDVREILLEYVDVVRIEGDMVHVLGKSKAHFLYYLHHIIHDIDTGEIVGGEVFSELKATCFMIGPPNRVQSKVRGKVRRYRDDVNRFHLADSPIFLRDRKPVKKFP